MDNKDAAYQRKNHVLSDSSKRLKNLVKTDHEEEEEGELKAAPELSTTNGASMGSGSPRAASTGTDEPEEEVVEEGDPSTVRFVGYLQLHLFFFAFLVGAFVCHNRHGTFSLDHAPAFVKNLFKYFEKRNFHVLAHKGFALWDKVPGDKRKVYVKYMTYGTIFLSLYPSFSGANAKRPSAEARGRSNLPPPPQEPSPNKMLVKLGTSVLRMACATMVCGFLGYDLAYNFPLLKAMFFKK